LTVTNVKNFKLAETTILLSTLFLLFLKIQDGGGRHLEKSKNHHISAAVQAISTKYGTVTLFN